MASVVQFQRPSIRRVRLDVKTHAARQQMLVYVPPHPLVKHWLAIVRNAATPPSMFRGALAELGRILLYEASKDFLQTVDAIVTTPLSVESDVTFIDPSQPIKVVPILRGGLVLHEHAASILPVMETYHVGVEPNQDNLQPMIYLNKLPEKFSPDDRVVILDPVVGTGDVMLLVLDKVINRGAETKNIYIICAITAPPALQKISEKYPELRMYTSIIDPELDPSTGQIRPGLGNVSDRSFGTSNRL